MCERGRGEAVVRAWRKLRQVRDGQDDKVLTE